MVIVMYRKCLYKDLGLTEIEAFNNDDRARFPIDIVLDHFHPLLSDKLEVISVYVYWYNFAVCSVFLFLHGLYPNLWPFLSDKILY